MIGYNMLSVFGKYVKEVARGEKVGVVTHPKIEQLYGETVFRSLNRAGFDPVVIRIPEGERYKTLDRVSLIYDRLILHRFERSSTLIALGGGVVGDMTGFAAATFLRGIAYVQCPTTVVGQVDAAIGGKTGVDHPEGKNLIGAFHQPSLVFIDPATLQTLQRREFVAGLAEVVKYGVIFDPEFFEFLEDHVDSILRQDKRSIATCIKRSAQIKAEIVSADEKEAGLRKILNYGHTLGHAIEAVTEYRRVKHGEAISLGMIAAAEMAHRLGIGSLDVVNRQKVLLRAFGLPTKFPRLDPSLIITVLETDKKVLGGESVFVLPEKIGSVRVQKIKQDTLVKLLNDLCLNENE